MSKSTIQLAELILAVYPNIRRVFRHLVSLKDAPITMTQLTCLSIIVKQENHTMTTLAQQLNMSNQQLTKVVDTLEEFSLVQRHVDPQNRRQTFVCATQKGKDLIISLREEIDRKLKFVLRRQEEGEIDKLYDSLSYVASYFANVEDKD